jgi:thiol-disulfide isomerase/thioredoxin
VLLLGGAEAVASQGVLYRSWIPAAERPRLDLSGSLSTLDGKRVPLQELKGKALLINAWATWCGPCRLEMPYLADLHRRLSNEGLAIAAVSWEEPGAVRTFIEETGADYPFLLLSDPDRILQGRFQVTGLPTTLIVDARGRLALHHVGMYVWNSPEVVSRIRHLLAE